LFTSPDLLHQLISDREQDLLRSAAAGRNAQPSQVRRYVARSLRRAADRLDEATAAPAAVRNLDAQR
jgi:hypothetical protein